MNLPRSLSVCGSIALLFVALPTVGKELPADLITGLGAEEFRSRERSEAQLLAWSRQCPEDAMSRLLKLSRNHAEPEVRERSLSVLKELVHDEYLRDGEGYVGIWMRDDSMLVPGDDQVRKVVFVLRVMPGSAAEKAGLAAGDVIAGTSDATWYEGKATENFQQIVRGLKPRSKITLKVLREGALIDLEIVLGRRPQEADEALRQGDPELAEAAAREAKENHFKAWLEQNAPAGE